MVFALTNQKRVHAMISPTLLLHKGTCKDQKGKGKEGAYNQSGLSDSETPSEEGYAKACESDDWSSSHWPDESSTSAAGLGGLPRELVLHGLRQSLEPCHTSVARCSGSWLHTVDWIKSGNRQISEACMV